MVLPAPLDDLGDAGPLLLGRTGPDGQIGLEHDLGRADGRAAVAVVETADVVDAALVAQQIEPAVADEARRHVGAVSPGVHADGTTHRAGYADGPREPGPAGLGHPSGQHGQGQGGPGPHDRSVSPVSPAAARPGRGRRRRGSGRVSPAKPEPRRRTSPSKPASATNRFDPRPITKTAIDASAAVAAPAAPTRPTGGPDRLEVVGSLHLGEECRRSADAVGGHRPERLVTHGPGAEGVGQGLEKRERPSPRRRIEQHVGQRREIARTQGQAEIARLQGLGHGVAQLLPGRGVHDRQPRIRRTRTASATRRPDTPGTGGSPAL